MPAIIKKGLNEKSVWVTNVVMVSDLFSFLCFHVLSTIHSYIRFRSFLFQNKLLSVREQVGLYVLRIVQHFTFSKILQWSQEMV